MINDVTYKYEFFITTFFVLWSTQKKQNLIKFVDLKYT
jgi:hypothetical protein